MLMKNPLFTIPKIVYNCSLCPTWKEGSFQGRSAFILTHSKREKEEALSLLQQGELKAFSGELEPLGREARRHFDSLSPRRWLLHPACPARV
jgi:hypothetical protein